MSSSTSIDHDFRSEHEQSIQDRRNKRNLMQRGLFAAFKTAAHKLKTASDMLKTFEKDDAEDKKALEKEIEDLHKKNTHLEKELEKCRSELRGSQNTGATACQSSKHQADKTPQELSKRPTRSQKNSSRAQELARFPRTVRVRCNECWAKKRSCDYKFPKCSLCRKSKIRCRYSNPHATEVKRKRLEAEQEKKQANKGKGPSTSPKATNGKNPNIPSQRKRCDACWMSSETCNCDYAWPSCTSCKEKNITCRYQNPNLTRLAREKYERTQPNFESPMTATPAKKQRMDSHQDQEIAEADGNAEGDNDGDADGDGDVDVVGVDVVDVDVDVDGSTDGSAIPSTSIPN